MVSKTVLKRGHILLEVAVGMVVLTALAYFLLYTTVTAFAGMTFATYSSIADNFLENEAAYVRAAEIQPDGALVLPGQANAPAYTVEGSTAADVVLFGENSNYKGTITTSRRFIESVGGGAVADERRVWEYVIELRFSYPEGSGGSRREYQKTRTVRKIAQG